MFSLPKTYFGLLTTKLVALKFRSQKTAFFVSKRRCTQLYSTKNMFWSVCRKLCCFQRCYTGERFSSSLQWVTLRFAWFYSKQRFYLILDKLHCFRILFLRTTFSFVFATKLHFWCSILPKKCSGLLATKLGWFEPHVTKNSVFPFLCLKYPAFSLNTGKTCFGLFAVKLGCYQHYCT